MKLFLFRHTLQNIGDRMGKDEVAELFTDIEVDKEGMLRYEGYFHPFYNFA